MNFLKILSLVALLLAAGCVRPGVTPVTAPDAHGIGNGSPVFLAVWEIEDLTPGSTRYSGIGGLLADRVMEVFSESEKFIVVERRKLLLALEELNIGTSQLTVQSQRLAVGKITGARYMLFGAFQVYGKRIRVDLRIVEVETGKVIKTASQTVNDDTIPKIADAAGLAAEKILSRL